MQKDWYQDLNEYIRLGEPKLEEKTVAWQTAIGLQAVDGLSTSDYLLETAKENIEGKITISEANDKSVVIMRNATIGKLLKLERKKRML